MRFWANLVGYQLVWFAAVIGAGRGWTWPGVLAAALFVASQLLIARDRAAALRLMAAALAMGCVLDGVLAASGWGRYAAPWPSPQFAPMWILAMWAAFAMTLDESLAVLQRRLWLAFALGLVGGPLSYVAAARGWGAFALVAPDWRGLAWLALAWALALTALALLARRWSRRAGTFSAVGEGAR